MLSLAAFLICNVLLGAQNGVRPENVSKPADSPGESTTLSQAKHHFELGQYEQAIESYKAHLRANPKDYRAWTYLGASHYYTGQVRQALAILKRAAKRASDLQTNFYYQALAYRALKMKDRSKLYFAKASSYNGPFAKAAIYELTLLEYRDRNKKIILYWVAQYATRFPRGEHRRDLTRIKQAVQADNWDLTFQESESEPDPDEALFQYSKYSLTNYPHYWFATIGLTNEVGTQNSPQFNSPVQKEEFSNNDLLFEAGIGLGPFRTFDAETMIGYHYLQDWASDEDRLRTYFDDPLDFEYFPFRSDLLTRRHRFIGDFLKRTNKFTSFGLYTYLEFQRSGSTFFPVPEEEEALKQTLNVSRTTYLVPWFSLTYNDSNVSTFYMNFRKEIDLEVPEFSNKSYDFESNSLEKTFSLGLKHRLTLKPFDTSIETEFFRFDYTYNDYWLDRKRTGFLIRFENEFLTDMLVRGMAGIFQDSYEIKQIKTGSCVYNGVGAPPSSDIRTCARNDMGLIYGISGEWRLSSMKKIEAFMSYLENKNPDIQVFDSTSLNFGMSFTFSFPNADNYLINKKTWGDDDFRKVN
jgi:tetratricopeptide (TPR) repeat protein